MNEATGSERLQGKKFWSREKKVSRGIVRLFYHQNAIQDISKLMIEM